jgi:hypothetical protein
MKKLSCFLALVLVLALGGCATDTSKGSSASSRQYTNPNWGTDATCAPGCPPGQGEGW